MYIWLYKAKVGILKISRKKIRFVSNKFTVLKHECVKDTSVKNLVNSALLEGIILEISIFSHHHSGCEEPRKASNSFLPYIFLRTLLEVEAAKHSSRSQVLVRSSSSFM